MLRFKDCDIDINRLENRKRFHVLFGNSETTEKVPVLNDIVVVYVGIVLLTFSLYLIAPFVTFISQTPFYSMQTYLGVIGGILLLVDLFTNRVLWRGKWCALLYFISIIAIIASLRTISYGIADNVFIICWTIIQFSLFYSCAYRLSGKNIGKYLKIVYGILLFLWCIACCISIYQFVFQIGYEYVVDPFSDDGSPARQGFVDHRLFGIFNPLNHSVYVSVILLVIGCYYVFKVKSKVAKGALIFSLIVLFSHIILSGSRSAFVAMTIGVFFVSFLEARLKFGSYKCGISWLLAVLITVLFVSCFFMSKNILNEIPEYIQNYESSEYMKTEDNSIDEKASENKILEREGLEDNVSNGRIEIWKDYLSLSSEIGIFGFSPGNYMSYIRENYPDMYIVTYIDNNFPGKAKGDLIYHTHNGYLATYVSTGLLGALGMIIFILYCIFCVLRYIIKTSKLSQEYIFMLAIVFVGAISAMFDIGVFFARNPMTFMFWFALGYVMMVSCEKESGNNKIIVEGRQKRD